MIPDTQIPTAESPEPATRQSSIAASVSDSSSAEASPRRMDNLLAAPKYNEGGLAAPKYNEDGLAAPNYNEDGLAAPKYNEGGQPATPSPNRAHGKVARLPKLIRDQINHWLLDGVSYPEIIKRLGDHGQDLKPDNISQWKKRGHQQWLKD